MNRRVSALALLLTACGDPPRPAGDPSAAGPGGVLSVQLGDSVAFENELTAGHLFRVLVRHDRGIDTLPGVLVAEVPTVAGDTTVVGVRYDEDRAVGLFVFDRRTRRTQVLAPPADWWVFATPALAPGGRHVAYLARDAQGRGYGVIAAIPSLRPVLAGPPVDMLETDVGVDLIGWADAQHVEIRIALTYRTGGAQRMRATVAPPKVVIDTVPDDPVP